MFVTPIIKSGPEINAFAFKTVNFASPMINSVLEILDSAPEMIDFGFHMVNCELETIISGVHVIIVKASITISVLVAVFLRTEIINRCHRSGLFDGHLSKGISYTYRDRRLWSAGELHPYR